MNTSESQFQALADINNEFHRPIFDGIVDEERFYLQEFPVLWILKEPWEKLGENVIGGGWSVTQDLLLNADFTSNRGTFPPMAYVAYSILHDFISCESIPKMTQDLRVRDALRTIAYINIKKFPGKTRANYKIINEYFHKYKDFLFSQIKEIDPKIVICGGTGHYIVNTYGLSPKPIVDKGPACCEFDGRNWIFAYHPSQTTIGKKQYVDGITNTIKAMTAKP